MGFPPARAVLSHAVAATIGAATAAASLLLALSVMDRSLVPQPTSASPEPDIGGLPLLADVVQGREYTTSLAPSPMSTLRASRRQKACEPPVLSQVVTHLSHKPFPSRLGRCALVGSSGNLKGGKRGKTIDASDTVIRINRVPTSDFAADMGRRTDILFKNLLSEFQGDRTKIQYMVKNGSNNVYSWCDHRSKDGCPTKAILYEGAERSFQEQNQWNRLRHVAFPYVFQSDAMQKLEHDIALLGDDASKVPSAGLKAFLTVSMLCDELRLFGFGDMNTSDGHRLATERHSLNSEHEFYDRVAQGHSLLEDFKPRPIAESQFGNADPGHI
eukprot:CAMPEP_0206525506 /NCGR_PEP_ID=MMETSP0325_2-20121206/13_1 /ASSEMBLY_ACC=CAM_ASM_000347 /TAXON_ID=2866 /ORGANISM="Crypthecodinium cohnii, Strain Seligo" /LENGTH=328 /DNA_ID=CAMNT_0054020177 /DNA_START=42 /DNA_END=1025 /DNA_ORIENTATION=-